MRKLPSNLKETTPLPCFYFSNGSRVEVRTEQGAWLPAHVINSNSNPSLFSLRNRKRRLLVEYETLVSDDDDSKPLTEEIEVSLLRPAPPESEEEGFEAHDVVDAFHVEGWWRGVVMSVDGDKYTVGFKSPPDLLELGRGELRRHWDWCGGAWTKAGKEVMMRLDFCPGDDVEVNLHKERIWYAWTPATYVGPLGGNTFLVRYESANNGDEKAVVSRHQIRPPPPEQEEGIIDLMSMVDAYHDMSWWVGDITAVLTGGMYAVKFRYTNQVIDFTRSDLRHHMEWNGSKWLTTEALEESMVNEEQTPCYTKSPMKQSTVFVDKSPTKKLKLSQWPENSATFSSPTPSKKFKGELSEDSLCLATLFGRATPVDISKTKGLFKVREKSEQQLVGQLDGEATSPVKKGGRRRKMPVNSQSPSVKQNGGKARQPKLHVKKISRIDNEQILEDDHVINGIESSGIGAENEVMGGSHSETSCLLPLEDNQQHTKDGVSSAMEVKRKLPMIVAEHSKDPTTVLPKWLVGQLDGEATSPVKKGGRRRKTPGNSQSPSVKQYGGKARRPKLHVKKSSGIDTEQILEGDHAIKGIESSGFGEEIEVMGGSHSGTSCLLPIEDNQQHTKDGASSTMEVKGKLPTTVAEHSIDPMTGSQDAVRHGLAAASVLKVQVAVSGMAEKEPDHHQSSSLFNKEGDSVNIMEQSIRGKVTETGVKGDRDQEECLPFVKSIPLWESIESMEVFKRFPQKPHFRPLLKIKRVLREGSAFGKMLAFASLVDQTTKLRVSDPRDVIESNLEATVELEMHGFDVNAIKYRLTKLLELKFRLEELHNQSNVVESKIVEWSQNTVKDTETISKIDKEIEDLEENIKVLKEKREMVVSMCSAKDSEANKLQSEAGLISEGIKSIRRSFELLAAGPL